MVLGDEFLSAIDEVLERVAEAPPSYPRDRFDVFRPIGASGYSRKDPTAAQGAAAGIDRAEGSGGRASVDENGAPLVQVSPYGETLGYYDGEDD